MSNRIRNTRLLILFLIVFSASLFANFTSNIDEAFSRAKKENKPLLISFFGIWCPPCNELEETVFESSAFLKSAQGFVLLKVDADAQASWSIKDRFHVGGYPTVVFASPAGKEIYRIVGYRAAREFLRTMHWVYDNRMSDLERACLSPKTEYLWRCGYACSEKKDQACATQAFEKLKKKLRSSDPRLAYVRTYFAEVAPDKAQELRKLIQQYPTSPFVFLWAADLIEGMKAPSEVSASKDLFENVAAQYPAVLKHRDLHLTGLAPTDIAQIRADIMEKLGHKEKAKLAWKEADSLLAKLVSELPKGAAARGYALERIFCLSSAGDMENALAISDNYRKRFPNEFTFHFRSATLLKKMGRTDDAVRVGEEALTTSYGDNKIRTATLLIELFREKRDKESAKKIYDQIKKELQPASSLDVRTHRYLKGLDEAFSNLS